MDNMLLVLAVAGATYLTRIAGFAIGRRPLPQPVNRFLNYVPVAAFAALIVSGIDPAGSDLLPRILGVLLAGVAVLKFRALWTGLAAGMATFWLAAYLFTGGPG